MSSQKKETHSSMLNKRASLPLKRIERSAMEEWIFRGIARVYRKKQKGDK